jgi:hypothetical protein
MEFKKFDSEIQDTRVVVLHENVSVHEPSPSPLSDLLGGSTSMHVDVDIETEVNAYTRVQQVPLDTDLLMFWKQLPPVRSGHRQISDTFIDF